MPKTELDQDLEDFEAPDIAPEDIAEHCAGILTRLVESTGIAEVVDTKAAVGQIHVMCRVKMENEKRLANGFLEPVLLATRGVCDVFLGKQFFLKENTDTMVYAWTFGFGSDDLVSVLKLIEVVVDDMRPSTKEVTEVPLMGPGSPQGFVGKGGKKGAAPLRAP